MSRLRHNRWHGAHRYFARRHVQHPQRVCRAWALRARLEIHNLGLAVEQLDADLVCLQRCASCTGANSATFTVGQSCLGPTFWPGELRSRLRAMPSPSTGERGNALLTRLAGGGAPARRHLRCTVFEQRGLLHVQVQVQTPPGARHRGASGLDPGQPGAAGCSACSNSSSARCPGRARGGGRRFQRLGPQLRAHSGGYGCGRFGERPGPTPNPGLPPLAQLAICTRGASRL